MIFRQAGGIADNVKGSNSASRAADSSLHSADTQRQQKVGVNDPLSDAHNATAPVKIRSYHSSISLHLMITCCAENPPNSLALSLPIVMPFVVHSKCVAGGW